MKKIISLFCKYLLILTALGLALPGYSTEQFPHDDFNPEQSQIFNTALNSQLFKPGLYWNPQRQGWGINITQVSQDDGVKQLVAVIYTYRADGSPIWYLASAPLNGSSWNATLQEYFWNGSSAVATDIGIIKLDFNAFDQALMSYTIHGESGSETIEFFDFAQGQASTELTALWFPPSEPGRGLTVSTIGNTNVVVLYFYDNAGKPLWLLGALEQAIVLGTEVTIPVDVYSGYCLACTTVNTNATQAGAAVLLFNSRSTARLVTNNISGWQADVAIVPLSDVLETEPVNEAPVVSGGGSCVDVPLVASGSRIVVNVTTPSGGNLANSTTIRDMTFTEVSETGFTIEEITTTEVTTTFGVGQTSRTVGTTTVSHSIRGNKVFLNSTNSTIKSETGTFISETRYSPELFNGPILTYCEGETWTQPSVTQSVILNGDASTSMLATHEGVINSINQSLSVPAGQFTTVFLTIKSADTIHNEWRDINSGHIIKIEEFNPGESIPRWKWEATLVQS